MGALNQLVLLEDRGAVRVLTMNRPEVAKCVEHWADQRLVRCFDRRRSRCVGACSRADRRGSGVLCRTRSQAGAARWVRLFRTASRRELHHEGRPAGQAGLGAINGPAITGGMEMALGCDFLVASDQAVFADSCAGGHPARCRHDRTVASPCRGRDGALALDDRRGHRCCPSGNDGSGHGDSCTHAAAGSDRRVGDTNQRGGRTSHAGPQGDIRGRRCRDHRPCPGRRADHHRHRHREYRWVGRALSASR